MSFTYTVLLRLLDFAKHEHRDNLNNLAIEQGVPLMFSLSAIRRKQNWAIELPLGCFLGDFRPGFVSFDDELKVRDGLIDRLQSADKNVRYGSGRMIIHANDRVYYHQYLIRALKDLDTLAIPSFFNAMYAFLLEAQKNPSLIKGKKQRPFVPLEKRKAVFGHDARGPSWRPDEDTLLRQWFGQRTVGSYAGQHVPLTREEWASVIAALGHRRTEASIRQRISMLNNALRRELSVDGYIPRDKYREYFSRVLGEKPRRPRMTPSRRKPRRVAA